eukprot:gnl/TRDRNA2_/TRDRNA2_171601_c0_seq5.p1 gnl/TRDRNA2_/TRDRNA2_171601_c0~~gnl/TRDRNA2_/TRDRNA2_171601_c0_seq5.p1  ORF type:complete len:325 (+),score=57.72 gnl/TRDRNA2_/TRDRNA2_171601_c0_seq5:56-1030(+)
MSTLGQLGSGSNLGTVKSFGSTGYGFITDASGDTHFVHVSDCGNSKPQVGDMVTFDIADNPVKPGTTKAINVSGGTAPLHDGQGYVPTPRRKKDTAIPWTCASCGFSNTPRNEICGGGGPLGCKVSRTLGGMTGVVTTFGPSGYGFITASDGSNHFVHVSDCGRTKPQVGDTVQFDVADNPAKPGTTKAVNVTVEMGALGDGANRGIVKSFGPTGYGFITAADGSDIFVHISNCDKNRPQAGDTVAFDIEDNPAKPGTLKAVNVTGGTAPLHDGKGKGGKDDKGKGGGYGPMWGDAGMAGGSPYEMQMMQLMKGAASWKGGKGW